MLPSPAAAGAGVLNVFDVEDALKTFLEGNGARASTPDIRGLAESLLEDLQSKPHARSDPLPAGSQELEVAKAALFEPTTDAQENSAQAWQFLRRLGNGAFGSGLIWPAEAVYRLALEEADSGTCPPQEASKLASNRALALLKAGHHQEAADAAVQALEWDGSNAKAAYRKAQAFLEISSGKVAGKNIALAAHDAVEAAELSVKLAPSDSSAADLLKRAKARAEKLGSAAAEPAVLDDMD
jgi:hypothetical protein